MLQERYYMRAILTNADAPYGSLYNIYDRTRKNQWGEQWCENTCLTWRDVWPILNQLNREDRESRQDVVSWWAL